MKVQTSYLGVSRGEYIVLSKGTIPVNDNNKMQEKVPLNSPSGSLLNSYYGIKNNSPAFRGAPWKLNLSYIGIPSYGSLTAEQAIKVFRQLKLGNYLDIGNDKTSYWSNKIIRDANLEFLDRVTSTHEKQKFIDYYKNLTGFPNLTEVSSKIKNEFLQAITKASRELNYNYYGNKYDIITAGYDGVCSVGRNKALPGSDLDKAYVIISGGRTSEANEVVNRFKGKIWENTDQRILSYNHDDAAFPQVYTKEQLTELVRIADSKVFPTANFLKNMPFYTPTALTIKLLSHSHIEKQTERFLGLQNVYNTNYVAANEFYIKLCQKFPKSFSDLIDISFPSRENIKNLGFVLEAIREGEILAGSRYALNLEDSLTYKFTNLSQLHALKQRGDAKPKRFAREIIPGSFDNWDTDKQYRFIKTLIYGSCANNNEFTTEFAEFFSKSGENLFEPLINALMG